MARRNSWIPVAVGLAAAGIAMISPVLAIGALTVAALGLGVLVSRRR